VTPEELRARLVSAGLGRHADALVGLARPSARLRSTPTSDEDLRIGASKLGGNPDLPPSFRWPDREGRPLSFIAQIALSETAAILSGQDLPTSGLLSFFYDAEEQPGGLQSDDRGSWAVIFSAPSIALERCEPPGGLAGEWRFRPFALEPALEITFVPGESAHVEALGLSFDQAIDYALVFDEPDRQPIHRLLGHPDPIQGDMQVWCQLLSNDVQIEWGTDKRSPQENELRSAAVDWRLLLQIDTQDDAGMEWGDTGRIYYWIRSQDLAMSAWSGTWLILQCS
jgi:hypothetical protein